MGMYILPYLSSSPICPPFASEAAFKTFRDALLLFLASRSGGEVSPPSQTASCDAAHDSRDTTRRRLLRASYTTDMWRARSLGPYAAAEISVGDCVRSSPSCARVCGECECGVGSPRCGRDMSRHGVLNRDESQGNAFHLPRTS